MFLGLPFLSLSRTALVGLPIYLSSQILTTKTRAIRRTMRLMPAVSTHRQKCMQSNQHPPFPASWSNFAVSLLKWILSSSPVLSILDAVFIASPNTSNLLFPLNTPAKTGPECIPILIFSWLNPVISPCSSNLCKTSFAFPRQRHENCANSIAWSSRG